MKFYQKVIVISVTVIVLLFIGTTALNNMPTEIKPGKTISQKEEMTNILEIAILITCICAIATMIFGPDKIPKKDEIIGGNHSREKLTRITIIIITLIIGIIMLIKILF